MRSLCCICVWVKCLHGLYLRRSCFGRPRLPSVLPSCTAGSVRVHVHRAWVRTTVNKTQSCFNAGLRHKHRHQCTLADRKEQHARIGKWVLADREEQHARTAKCVCIGWCCTYLATPSSDRVKQHSSDTVPSAEHRGAKTHGLVSSMGAGLSF